MAELIVALDMPGKDALLLIPKLAQCGVSHCKIGSQLLFDPYFSIILDYLQMQHFDIFADFKSDDTPNTVQNMVVQADARHIKFISVRPQALPAALTAHPHYVKILVVPELTSELNISFVTEVKKSLDLGAHGIICAGHRIEQAKELGASLVITPGISLINPLYPEGSIKFARDHLRVVTAQQAVKSGANYLVVGRPITQAADPVKATMEFIEAMQR